VKGQEVTSKQSILYVVKDEKGRLYTTELSPFPGLSKDTLSILAPQFEQMMTKRDYSSPNPHLAFSFFELVLKRNWTKSLVDIASNDLITMQSKINGSQTLKIKINNDVDQVTCFLRSNQTQLQGRRLRLDANQRLTSAQAQEIYKACKRMNLEVEYFEEPFDSLSDYENSPVPFALDENITSFDYVTNTQLKALVFKPTQYFKQEIWQSSYPLVISSTFDSLFTHATLHAMANRYQNEVHGLAVYGETFGIRDYKEVFPTIREEQISF
jgi:O-succinylbenzoate synthase